MFVASDLLQNFVAQPLKKTTSALQVRYKTNSVIAGKKTS
jgi:hypothetical protein